MTVILPLIAVVLVWAWLTGRLRRFTLDDGIAATLFLLGLRLLSTGKPLLGAIAMGGGLIYGAYRRGRFARASAPMPLDDARRLLGVQADASTADIRAAHRRLIARVHPDAGGSEELAQRINAARDALIAEQVGTGSRSGGSAR